MLTRILSGAVPGAPGTSGVLLGQARKRISRLPEALGMVTEELFSTSLRL
jgi:hypothetical protein